MARETFGERETPTISCVIAAHNAERYLEEAINSILAQSLRDFELIVINDGSTDRTYEILGQYALRDARLVILDQESKGLTKSLIAGTAIARGRYIARMDADDFAEPYRFQQQVAFLDQNPNHVAVGSSLTFIDPDSEFLAERSVPCGHEEILGELLQGNGVIPHPSAMFTRRAFEQVGGYREQFTAAQDLDLWLRLAEVGQLANLPDRLLRYRLHANSVTNQKREVQLACAQQAVREARRRRGDPQAESFAMLMNERTNRARTLRGWARMALKSSRPTVARKHAWSAFRDRPFNPSHWWLLARTFV